MRNNKSIRIGYFADGPWSHLAFEKIINNKFIEISFIIPRFDTQDDTLKKFAKQYNIDYLKFKNINALEAIEKLRKYKCDLFVSMSFNQIFKKQIINLCPYKIINCHAGKLPYYRGRNVLNWALINDEKEFGITVHYVDEGIDTGDIINQKTFPITDEDNYKTLLSVSYKQCAEMLYEVILDIAAGNIKRIIQKGVHPVGFYCGKREEGDEIIDWNQTSREIFNFIRAICAPGPQARSFVCDSEVKINKVREVPDAPIYKGKAGQILCKTENGFYVKTKDSFIEVIEFEGKLKIGEVMKKKCLN